MARARERAPARKDRTVHLDVPARPGYIVLARLALAAICRLTPLDHDDVADLKLAVTEAASTFVGVVEEGAAPLEPVLDPEGEQTLRFAFELRPREIAIEVACDGDLDVDEAERELSRAIIESTVDRVQSEPGAIRLAKEITTAG